MRVEAPHKHHIPSNFYDRVLSISNYAAVRVLAAGCIISTPASYFATQQRSRKLI
jgi:hypothetical protein